jgi:glycosyltransferase involved in cell wall biosynthesis
MNKLRLFSIITINYNNLSGLQKTLESVVSQTYRNIQYIVIDGGSTDGSKEYIQEKNEFIDYWVSESDNGIYHAMNKGIKIAIGEYCLFLNSGDYLVDSEVLDQVINKKLDADIIYGNLLKGNNNDYFLDKGISSSELTFLQLYNSTINHPASFIKTSLFRNFGLYKEDFKIVSDWEFFFRVIIFHNVQVKYIDVNISYFDLAGISSKQLDLIKKERYEVIKSYFPELLIKEIDYYSSMKYDLNILEKIFKFPFLKKIFRGVGFLFKQIKRDNKSTN